MFSKEEMKMLEPMEVYFKQAVYHNYKRSTTSRETQMVSDLYNKVTGTNEHRNLTCGACVLTLFKKAGEIYFKTKEEMEKEVEQVEEPVVEEVKEETEVQETEIVQEELEPKVENVKEKPTKARNNKGSKNK